MAAAAVSATPGPSEEAWAAATPAEFDEFVSLCDVEKAAGWKIAKAKGICRTWVQKPEGSDIVLLRLQTEAFESVPGAVLYDVLCDPDYRRVWDLNCIDMRTVVRIDKFNELSYYSARTPTPLSNRDWLLKCATVVRPENRQWILINRSVASPLCPPKAGFVRANSLVTGYLITGNAEGTGCELVYISHNEWNGSIPAFVVNTAVKSLAPSVVDKLLAACRAYPAWKAEHNPEEKPWL